MAVSYAPIADLGSSCNRSGTPAALLARPCTLLTLSELSFTVGEVFSALPFYARIDGLPRRSTPR